ncbi:MAG: hypothetical protein ABIP75_02505 [Pyrinomonadaceae bacterium]
MQTRRVAVLVVLILFLPALLVAQENSKRTQADRDIAERFAPEFHQSLGPKPRFDYITNFNFDGNWRGDDNWANADNQKFTLKAFVYYSVTETKTHYFIHYATFHPRDYKGGDKNGALLSELLRQGAELGGKYDPTGKLSEAALAHENDLEGCLVVVAKGDSPDQGKVVYVETVSHNRYLKYVTAFAVPAIASGQIVHLENSHPQLYVEPKGHGIEAWMPDKQTRADRSILVYQVGATASDPERARGDSVSYELVSMLDDLWPRAGQGVNETYGDSRDYREIKIQTFAAGDKLEWHSTKARAVGSTFLGKIGMPNAARPPWGWFDGDLGVKSAGEWFFDPAGTVKGHFGLGDSFSTVYLSNSFLSATTTRPASAAAK